MKSIAKMLQSKLNFSRVCVRLVAEEDCRLPSFTGSLIRGSFGHALKKAFCVMHHRDCENCLVSNSCGYFQVFESTSDTYKSMGFQYKSHPYIIIPSSKSIFLKKDILQFKLTMFGEYKKYIPYFVYAFQLMGGTGFGRDRCKFSLVSVKDDLSNEEIYEDGRLSPERIVNANLQSYSDGENETGDIITIEFVTPARLVEKGKPVSKLNGNFLLSSMIRRYSMMNTYYGEFIPEDVDSLNLEITPTEEERFISWKRYSNRQQKKVAQGGVVGTYSVLNPDEKLFRFIKAMEVLHIGKNTSFGLGQIKVG